jgi:hypothetical protein
VVIDAIYVVYMPCVAYGWLQGQRLVLRKPSFFIVDVDVINTGLYYTPSSIETLSLRMLVIFTFI